MKWSVNLEKTKLHDVIHLGPQVNKRSQSAPIKINAMFSYPEGYYIINVLNA